MMRGALAVLLALSVVRNGAAQVQVTVRSNNCASSDGTMFQLCTTILDFQLFWNYNADNTTLDMLYERPDTGYAAVGFSPQRGNGAMANSSVVMGCAPFVEQDATNADFFLSGRGPVVQGDNPIAADPLRQGQGRQGLQSYSFTQADNVCSVRFTRPFAPARVSAEENVGMGPSRVVVANGGALFGFHAAREYADFNLAPQQPGGPDGPDMTTTGMMGTNAPGSDNSATGLSTAAVAVLSLVSLVVGTFSV